MTAIDPNRLIFIGGLHRSGTTALGRILADHHEISGLRDTGATEDEGQHLQSAYRPASKHGGVGRFALNPDAHLTELDTGEAEATATQLIDAWSPHWNLTSRFLVEKSPPNLIMGRYLQSVFPGSALVMILRHPVVVALSTKKWTRFTSLSNLMEHWFQAHEILRGDALHLCRLHVLRYEDLLRNPDEELGRLQTFLDLTSTLSTERIDTTRSDPYLKRWHEMDTGNLFKRRRRSTIQERYTRPATRYGYLLGDRLGTTDHWNFSSTLGT